jgi:esterase/lipase superfamily enzyme
MLAGARVNSFLQNVQTSSGIYSFTYSMGTGVLSQRIKQLRHEPDHSLPSSAKVINERSYTSTPQHMPT